MPKDAVLVTGAAGFIGFHVARRLLVTGRAVVGVDNFDDYYSVSLKRARIAQLARFQSFRFVQVDLADRTAAATVFADHQPQSVIHLAARAGVRNSIKDPHTYVDYNITAFINVLDQCRHSSCRHFLYASSSSVYGANTTIPFSVRELADHPVSLYAATKRANELMAHSYSHLFRLPSTGLRFFTAYGPWGRPDMAMFLFASAIVQRRPIQLFNHGRMRRDFTYVDDVTGAVVSLLDHVPTADPEWVGGRPNPATSQAPWRVYNVGSGRVVDVGKVIDLLAAELGIPATVELADMQPGDVPVTFSDNTELKREIGFEPRVAIEDGVRLFVEWYRDYRGIS